MEIKSEQKSNVCKLCFQYCYNNFEVLNDEANKMLELLLLKKPDFNIGEEQIICTNCSGNMKMSFKFKSTCLNIENYVKSHTNSEGGSKVNLNEICENGIDNKDTVNLSEGYAVCRLCLKLVQNGCWALFNEETQKMLNQWLPELDLNITEAPVMCTSCQASLKDYFGFMKKCPDVEEKHYEFKEKCDADQNESKLNPYFMLENDLIHEECDRELKCLEVENINEIKVNSNTLMDIKIQEMDIEQQEIHVKSDTSDFSRNDEAITLSGHNENAAIPKSKNLLHNCDLCTYSTNNRTNFLRHTVVHQDASSAVMYSCRVCPFTSKHESSLRLHMKIHREDVMIYQCEACEYKTKYKAHLKKHSLIHQSDLEVTLYQCEACKYKTKYKSSLNRHLLLHKYTHCCDTCSYKSNTQKDIDIHSLVHNEAAPKPKEEIYSCEACPYKTKHLSTFNRHKVTHLDTSDLGMYECKVCGYETKHKYSFSKHMRTHVSLKFRCDNCDFQTNRKKELEKHSLLHLPSAETKMFHCAECKFITKYKKNLTKHMVLHQKQSLVKMYRCDVCNFETKHKPYIKLHALVHEDPSERKFYTCDMCDCKVIRKRSLRKHKLKKHSADENK